MVHSNKILTVSYGTFSCTLEGFEDSFGTMKAIAEYFRDLAQQDRYFGAEPPQPDAEMLARIAQREIARRVEASHDGNGFVLRATDEQDRPAAALDKPAAPAPAPVAPAAGFAPEAIAAAAVAAMAGSGASAAPEQDAAPDAAAQDAVAEAAAEEVIAEDTARDMAEEIAADAEDLEDDLEDTVAEADEDEAADASEETDMAAFFGQSQAADMGDTDEDIADEPVSQIRMPDISAPAEPQAATEDAAASARSAAANSIAAKLQRIRAVVAQSDAAQTRSDYVEDQHAEVAQAPAADPIAAIMGEMGRKDADEQPAEAAVSARLLKVSREEFEAVLIEDSAEEEDSPLSEQDEEDLMRELAEVEAELGLDAAARDEDARDEDARDEDDLYAPDEDDLFEDELDAIGRKDLDEEDLDAIDEDDLVEDIMDLDDEDARDFEDEDEDAFEDLIARDEDKATDDEDDWSSIFAEDRDSDEEAPAKDDMPAVAEALDADEADEAEEAGTREGHALLDDEDLDEDLARLLAETDSQMDDAEASTRRADFDHLRAAVAAQKAEDEGEPRLIAAQPDAVYRDDLAQAVRPRRPEAPTEDRVRSRRPEDERPAPLKLVAAQRVDAEPAEVRPRRVVSQPMPEADAALADGQMSFAEFAESVGAYELPDLLEAAASYLAFVEGQDQFSRPQLMTKVRMLEPEEFSREDGLRSFGQLLRDGKIEKIQGGRFTVSDRIGFRPDDMRAAG